MKTYFRNKAIVKAWEEGASQQALATEHNITRCRVGQIIHRAVRRGESERFRAEQLKPFIAQQRIERKIAEKYESLLSDPYYVEDDLPPNPQSYYECHVTMLGEKSLIRPLVEKRGWEFIVVKDASWGYGINCCAYTRFSDNLRQETVLNAVGKVVGALRWSIVAYHVERVISRAEDVA